MATRHSNIPASFGASFRGGRIRLCLAVLSAGLVLAACAPKILQHGNLPDEEQVVQIQPGLDNKDRVQQLLGSPSTEGSFGQDIWYYVSKKTEQTGFFEPDVVDQGVLAVTFDQEGVVNDLKIYDQNDGRLVAMVDRETPTHGNEMSILQQLLGNLGRFDPESSSKPANPGNPTGP